MSVITVLGIDPGSRATGWGIVCERSGVVQLVECGVIRSGADKNMSFSTRLASIFHNISGIITRLTPDEAAVEMVFTAKNADSALKLGQARGVAVAACAAHGISVADYAATLIKKNLVGTGRAEKHQVSFMVSRILGVKPNWSVDAGDALAVALCHLTMRRYARIAHIA